MQIRPYQETDRPFLRTLYLASRKAAFGWRDTSNYQLEDFDGATLGEAIWVAEDGGTLLGFVSVYREDNFIHNLYVDPHQPPRVGSALLQAAEATFTATGSLKCLVKNEKALAFYRKHGWRIISTGNDGEEDYYLMHSAGPLALTRGIRHPAQRQPPKQQRAQADARPQPADAAPPHPGIHMGAGKGAQPAADGVKQHVAAHQPAVRLRVGTEDHALVQHVDRLARQIQQHDARHQPNQAAAEQTERQPGQRQQQQTHAAGRLPQPAIRQMPGAHRRQRAHRADQAERPHRGMGEVERRLAQRQHQRTPKEAESAEHQQRQHAANLQRAVMQQQGQH